MTRQQIIANLQGIFPPVVTPFDRRGEVDIERFRENLHRYVGIGLGGVVLAGSTGEAPYLTEDERLRLVEAARDVVPASELLIVGTGLESTRDTVRLSREAVARGADALLVLTPNYYKSRMDSLGLTAHFRAVADCVRRPIVIYSIPQFTGIRIEPDTIATLSQHRDIVGLKDSSGDLKFARSVLRKVKPGFRVFVGAAQILLQALVEGAAGGVLAAAGFMPELCVGVYDAFQRGRMKTARDLQARLNPLVEVVNQRYGVAGVKAALDLSGYAGGAPRAPLFPLDAAGRKAVAAALREARRGLEL